MPNTIETDRLLLRKLEVHEAPLVLDYFSRNAAFLQEWEAKRPISFYTEVAQRKQLLRDMEDEERGTLQRFWITEKAHPGILLGSVALSNIIRGAFQSCHLGYRLDEAHQGRGYMTEAVKALVDLGFQQMNLHRIEANVRPENLPSSRVLQKLGFITEGLSPSYLYINGAWVDHVHMVLIHPDWSEPEMATTASQTLKIRDLPRHFPLPYALLRLSSHDEGKLQGALSSGICRVAILQDQVVGASALTVHSEHRSTGIYASVSPAYRNMGIGRRMLRDAEQWAALQGTTTLCMELANSSMSALSFTQRCGFRIAEVTPDYFSTRHKEPIWENGILCRDLVHLVKPIT